MVIKGDVTQNGKITYDDLIMLQLFLLEKIELNENELQSADTNNDGEADIVDLAIIQRHLLGDIILGEVIE